MLPDTEHEKTEVNIRLGVVLREQSTEALMLIKQETKSAVLERVSEMKMPFI